MTTTCNHLPGHGHVALPLRDSETERSWLLLERGLGIEKETKSVHQGGWSQDGPQDAPAHPSQSRLIGAGHAVRVAYPSEAP